MRGFAAIILLGLAACAASDAVTPASASPEVGGWQELSGKPPSRVEFAAVMAACQDRAKGADRNAPIDNCLADLGLHRAQ
jgi:hypothetical protein